MWTEQFEELLRAYLTLAADHRLAPDELLADYGLDSMGVVSLLVDLEQTYDVTFFDQLLVPETFATAAGLWTVLSQLTDEVAAGADG